MFGRIAASRTTANKGAANGGVGLIAPGADSLKGRVLNGLGRLADISSSDSGS